MSAKTLARYYRESDDFRRYSMADERRVAKLRALYRAYRRYFGPRVLDIACGGGILGFVLDPARHSYVGIDLNADMIREARRYATTAGGSRRFVHGDATTARLSGRFDTVALLGNALCHFAPADLGAVLRRLRPHLAPRACFVVDYRDVVRVLFERRWKRRMVERRSSRAVVSETTGCDTERGEIAKEVRAAGAARAFPFTHAIWAPFVVEALMTAHGSRLVRRREDAGMQGWTDVYRRVAP